MNIITFFEDLTELLNKQNYCDECWKFGAPLGESYMNASKTIDDEKCCVHLFITFYKTSSSYTKSITGLKNREWCDHIFTLYVVKNSRIDLNIYNEQPMHPIKESIWKTIIEPLQKCIGCGASLIDLCELGYDLEIFKWDMEVVKKYEDNNYTGWKINGIFRQYF